MEVINFCLSINILSLEGRRLRWIFKFTSCSLFIGWVLALFFPPPWPGRPFFGCPGRVPHCNGLPPGAATTHGEDTVIPPGKGSYNLHLPLCQGRWKFIVDPALGHRDFTVSPYTPRGSTHSTFPFASNTQLKSSLPKNTSFDQGLDTTTPSHNPLLSLASYLLQQHTSHCLWCWLHLSHSKSGLLISVARLSIDWACPSYRKNSWR